MHTQRRIHVDRFLAGQTSNMAGHILDIGGKKINKRGVFQPPLSKVNSWKYVNLDPSTIPDYCCTAEKIPLADESIDGFLLCEVLEHVEQPEEVLAEAFRILKPGGYGWITMPFLCQIHADPHDYQRWTDAKFTQVLEKTGFSSVNIEPMGGVIAVIHDLWHSTLCRSPRRGRPLSKIAFRIWRYSTPLFSMLDKRVQYTEKWITTGWGIVVVK